MRFVQTVTAVVVRKGVISVGLRLGDHQGATGAMAYGLEIQEGENEDTDTIYLEYSRSKDFYRIPVGTPLVLKIGRHGTRPGRWLDTWDAPAGQDP